MQNVQNLKGEAMGDAGAFVALFRFHSPFLSNEEHLLVLFQPARQCQHAMGDAGAFVALFRFHSPFLSHAPPNAPLRGYSIPRRQTNYTGDP
jgi:hypothetical protein